MPRPLFAPHFLQMAPAPPAQPFYCFCDTATVPYFSTDHLPAPRAFHANSLSPKRLSSTIFPGCLTQACMLVFPLLTTCMTKLQPIAAVCSRNHAQDTLRQLPCPLLQATLPKRQTTCRRHGSRPAQSAKRVPPFHGQLAFMPLSAAKLPRTQVYLLDHIAHSKLAINSLRTNRTGVGHSRGGRRK